jgi:hypothetical protein
MAFYGEDYKAVVITEGGQCGAVDYDDNEDWIRNKDKFVRCTTWL